MRWITFALACLAIDTLAYLVCATPVEAKTPFNQTTSLTAEKAAVRWPRDGVAVDVVIAGTDGSTVRNAYVVVTDAGKVKVNGVDVAVAIPPEFAATLRAAAAAVDKLVEVLARAGKVGI